MITYNTFWAKVLAFLICSGLPIMEPVQGGLLAQIVQIQLSFWGRGQDFPCLPSQMAKDQDSKGHHSLPKTAFLDVCPKTEDWRQMLNVQVEWALPILKKVVCEESLVRSQISEGQGMSKEKVNSSRVIYECPNLMGGLTRWCVLSILSTVGNVKWGDW